MVESIRDPFASQPVLVSLKLDPGVVLDHVLGERVRPPDHACGTHLGGPERFGIFIHQDHLFDLVVLVA